MASFFPPVGGGGGSVSPIGLPDYAIYADPAGSDSAAGSQGAPKQTIYAATQAAIALGGGTVYFNDLTAVGGPVTDQGIWLRNDGVPVTGFLDIAGVRLRFCPVGRYGGAYVFERPGAAWMHGGSTGDYRVPGIWVVGTEVPVDFEYIKLFSDPNTGQGMVSPARLGWDYVRNFSGDIEYLTITNGNRAAASTTFDIDLSSATPWVISSATRASNTVTLTLVRSPNVAMAPWAIGAPIRVNTGGDTDFPNVDAIVTNQSDGFTINRSATTVLVSYVQAGANITKSLAGTVVSHGLQAGDYVATLMTSGEFVTCPQMTVTAATINTVTVFDPYGYSPRSASTGNVANPGQLIKQNRGRAVASAVTFNTCSFIGYIGGAADVFTASPALDLGGTSASDTRLYQCYFTGGNSTDWPGLPDYDPSRTQVAILSDPGAGTASGASFQAYDCQSQSGHVIFNPRTTEAHVYIDQWLQDSANNALPTVVCGDVGNALALPSVYLHRIGQADAEQSAVSIGRGYDKLKTRVGDIYSSSTTPVDSLSPILGPSNIRAGRWNFTTDPSPSPWQLGWDTNWTGGITGRHVNVNRAMGPVAARYANTFPAFANWEDGSSFPAGVTVTNDGLAPDGSSTAFKFVSDATNTVIIGDQPLASAVADTRVVFAAWVKFDNTNELQLAADTGATWDGNAVIRIGRNIIWRDAWQWVCIPATVTHAGGYHVQYFIAAAGTSYFWAPTFITVPADVADSDFWEFAHNLKHQPIYLPAGGAGTMDGQRFIADGGIGTNAANAKIVGGGSGQLTLTGTGTVYLPEYDRDGTTIIGWKAMLQATVNP